MSQIFAEVLYEGTEGDWNKKVIFGLNARDRLVFNSSGVEITASTYFTDPNGVRSAPQEIKLFIRETDLVPIVDQNGDPVLDNGEPTFIGELSFWLETYWDNASPISMRRSLEDAIKRRLKSENPALTFPEEPLPLVKQVTI